MEELQPVIAEVVTSVITASNASPTTTTVVGEVVTTTPSTDVDGVTFAHAASEKRRARVVEAAKGLLSKGEEPNITTMSVALGISPRQMTSYCSNPKRTTKGGSFRPSLEAIITWAGVGRPARPATPSPPSVVKKKKLANPELREERLRAIAYLRHARDLAIKHGLIRKDKTMARRLLAYEDDWTKRVQS
jgi:hypothetical protein